MPMLYLCLLLLCTLFTAPATAGAPSWAPIPVPRPAAADVLDGTPVPVPTPRPEIQSAVDEDPHTRRLLTRLALRYGAERMAVSHQTDSIRYERLYAYFSDFAADLRPKADRIPLWVTELTPRDLDRSLVAFISCNQPWQLLPGERPESTRLVLCITTVLENGVTAANTPRTLFFVQDVRPAKEQSQEIFGRLYRNGMLEPPTWLELVNPPATSQTSSR